MYIGIIGQFYRIINSIFIRLSDVNRIDGPDSYQQAIVDHEVGVDLSGNTMTSCMGRYVLPELLSMAKVGGYMDKPQQPEVDPLAVEWSQKNEWFGKDRVMTAAALALDADLKEEGFDSNDPDFYTEIDNRLKETFPHKFETNRVQEKPSKPAQVVAGASRSTPSSNKVKLTKEDVRLAQNWGIPLEQYAAEKLKVENADGEYTAIKT